MTTLLWLAAVVLVVCGVVAVLRGSVLAGLALIVVGCIIGPGGVSIYNGR